MKMKQCMVGILVLMLSFTISAEEFRTPVTIVGMVNAKNELVRPDDKMTFMSNGSTLTFIYDGAARNNDPGGGLVARAVTRDGAVYLDDNVALVFSEQPAGVIRQLAFNVNGIVFDRVRRKGAKWDDAWNAEGLEVISSEARSGRWHLAVRVPLMSVGAIGTTIINVMRESPGKVPAFARSTRDVFNGKGFDLAGLSSSSSSAVPQMRINPFQARTPIPPNRARRGEIPSAAEFKVDGADGAVLYYPGQNRMRVSVFVDSEAMPMLVFGGREIALKKDDGLWTVLVETPKTLGRFSLSLKLDERLFDNVATLEKRQLPWEGNTIGKADGVLPPFTPIAHVSENALSVVHRTIRFGGMGLPTSVRALGRELLAAPMSYEFKVDGSQSIPKHAAELSVSAGGTSASVVGGAKAGTVRLKSVGRFEYDGFLWNELALSGTGCIERLTVVVPLKGDEVPLFHAVAADTIRYNPAGCLPSGTGLVWGGSKLFRKPQAPDDDYEAAAVPYIWLGAERRGLCVFVNDTHGMALDATNDAVRIVRDAGIVRLEYDLINRPVELAGERHLAFGLQVTPVKTSDPAMRRWYQASNASQPKGMIARVGIGWRESGFENHWARVPKGGDWSLFTTAMSNVCFNTSSTPFKYSDPTLTWEKDDAVQYYASEWISRGTGYEGAVRTFLVPSSIDYVIYRCKEWTDLGLDGLYFDDMFLMPCRNPDTALGSFGIIEMRELVKRAAIMQHEAGLKHRFLQIHMTNALLVPSFAFATSLLSWEDHYGEEPFQKRFPIDYVRAESLGTQIGCEGVVLDGIKRKTTPEKDWNRGADGKFRRLTRNQHAILLPCGMTMWTRSGYAVDIPERQRLLKPLCEFRIWESDCRFVPFWEDDGVLGRAPDGILLSSYRRGSEALVIIGNLTDADQILKLSGQDVTVAAGDVATVRVSLESRKGRQ